jgi:hypothetical protein
MELYKQRMQQEQQPIFNVFLLSRIDEYANLGNETHIIQPSTSIQHLTPLVLTIFPSPAGIPLKFPVSKG